MTKVDMDEHRHRLERPTMNTAALCKTAESILANATSSSNESSNVATPPESSAIVVTTTGGQSTIVKLWISRASFYWDGQATFEQGVWNQEPDDNNGSTMYQNVYGGIHAIQVKTGFVNFQPHFRIFLMIFQKELTHYYWENC